jgi:MYXO-CTERM domain-containing protein
MKSWLALVGIPVVLFATRPANACGGCFRRPTESVTVVNAHRMVLSVSTQQTILWDQFSYSGNPSEFAWVLPVHAASVKVELAHDEFISALDAWTAPVITGPVVSRGGGIGCGSASSAKFGNPTDNPGVNVVNQEVVGPYEVVTLQSTDPKALESWLGQHGYDIPASVQPTVAAYVTEGFDFVALRLLPGQGIAAMQPVRVVSQGADPTLPLRMVAAGVGADVSILLWVISEGRYQAANFANTEVDFSNLIWNKNAQKSNYDDLVQHAMTQGDGRNFTIEFAGPLSTVTSTGFTVSSFSSTYYQGASSAKNCPYMSLHGPDFASQNPFDASFDPYDGGSADGGTSAHPYDACYFDDLTAATKGMTPADVVVTRLRADLKVSALSQDLSIQASPDQSPYTNQHSTNSTGDGCAATSETPDRSVVLVGLGVAAVALATRRRRSRG